MPAGDLRRNPTTGDLYQLQKDSAGTLRWVELGDEQASAAMSVAEGGIPASMLGGAVRATTFGLAGPPEAIVEQQQLQHPVASMVGEFSPLALGGVAGVGKLMAGRVAGQISAKGAALGAAATARATAERQLLRRPSNILGRSTSLGAAARHLEAGLEAIPGANLPLLYQKALNQRAVNAGFAAAMGLPDDAIRVARTDVNNVTADVLSMFRTGYRDITQGLDDALAGSTAARTDARSLIEEALQNGYVRPRVRRALENKATTTADDVFETMADLRELARAKDAPIQMVRDVDDLIERMDSVIGRALASAGDETSQAAHETLNRRYFVWREMRKGRTISADGQINVRTADGRFAAKLGDKYLEGEALAGDEAVNGFMRMLREGAALDVGLPSSGTTERAIAAGVIGVGAGIASQ